MGITVRGQVGPQVLQDGTEQAIREGRTGELLVTELHGKYFEQAYRSNIFIATMTGTPVTLSTPGTSVAYSLANPAGSGKLIVPIRFEFAITTAPGTQVLGYYGLYANINSVAATVTGTAMTTYSSHLATTANPVGKALSTATTPVTPTLYRIFEQKFGAIATGQVPAFFIDFDGTCIMDQGSALSICQNVADTTTNAFGVPVFIWEEIVP